MGKYSSDSEPDHRPSKSSKTRTRHRSSSSDSSDSRRNSRRSTKKSHRRSRSKERYSRTRRSRSSSYSRSRRSDSRERSKYRRRSKSRDRYRSRRSRSKSYIREYTSKPKRRSSSSSSESSRERNRSEKPSKSTSKSVSSSKATLQDNSPDCVIVDSKTLEQLNEDKFVAKPFTSSKANKLLDNIVIDLNKQTIKVPEVELTEPDTIFHHGLFSSSEARLEKWIRELYSYRQKALQQGWKNE